MSEALRIYIAGPYRPTENATTEQNIAVARKAAIEIHRLGHYAYCPHLNTANMEHDLPNVSDDHWLAVGLELLDMCDAIVVLPGWEKSSGTISELQRCENSDKDYTYYRYPIYMPKPIVSPSHNYTPVSAGYTDHD